VVVAVALAAIAPAADAGDAGVAAIDTGSAGVTALRLNPATTPRFRVAKYDTEGTYVQVEGEADLARVNAALRRIVTSDQRAYAKSARRAARHAGSNARGAYTTEVDPSLVSASTVVVSALMPSIHLVPGGMHGGVVLSGTVLVPSGRRVGLTRLFKRPASALRVLAREFKRAYLANHPPRYSGCVKNRASLHPSAYNYRHFALVASGLALGIDQTDTCGPLIATIPYDRLRPYVGHLGRRLIDAVRRPAAAS
jgi:hypothetical protein